MFYPFHPYFNIYYFREGLQEWSNNEMILKENVKNGIFGIPIHHDTWLNKWKTCQDFDYIPGQMLNESKG